MGSVVSVVIRGNRIPVATRSAMASGLAKAAVSCGWLGGKNQPRTRQAFQRACYAAVRKGKEVA